MRVIIIGAGPAGITAADFITELDPAVDCTVLTSENHPPYSPPLMYDHFVNGFNIFWKGTSFQKFNFKQNARVTDVNFEAKSVSTNSGELLHYDKLIIASGASLYVPVKGIHLNNVYNFKSLSDATNLIQYAKNKKDSNVVIIGAGLIGIEISLLLNKLNSKVTLIEKENQILPSLADATIANKIQHILESNGITVLTGTEAKVFKGDEAAREVFLSNGESIKADYFVAATGIRPQIDFLRSSDIRINRGICVDRYLKTSIDSVFAIGDCTEYTCESDSLGFVNHTFINAVEQAKVCACNILGDNQHYSVTCRANSIKHVSVPVLLAGTMNGERHVYSKNDEIRIVFLNDGKISGLQFFNSEKAAGVLTSLIKSNRDISEFLPFITSPQFNHSFLN